MQLVEGIAGHYVYHISETGENCKPALCGNKNVMKTGVRVSTWGMVSHLNEKYCKECERLAPAGFLDEAKKKFPY